MSALQAELLQHLPFKRKQTSGGWLSFDAPCCEYNGESKDTRQRGGIILQANGGFTYHCFNCGFKTSWQPGRQLYPKTKKFLGWINVPNSKINELALDALKLLESVEAGTFKFADFVEKAMPLESVPLMEAVPEYPEAVACLEYIINRGLDLPDCNWHYSPLPGYKDRLIIPFYHRSQLVGYTARKVVPGSPKYLSESQSGYVFNMDQQDYKNKVVIVTEGPFDALSIGGVGILTNLPNEQQIATINSLGKTVIVAPDRDYPGMDLVKTAMNNGWLVAMPKWEDSVKDVSDAVQKYGKLFTLKTILDTATDSKVKIELLIKQHPKKTKE
jgi:hypothetical protein